VYASAVAQALWTIDYARTGRDQLIDLLKSALATQLPAGSPAGSTVGQAQASAMSTFDDYVPTGSVWANLAASHTKSSFVVTGVTEPASWVAAVTSGQITDPGLTARTVTGVQSITYDGAVDPTTTTQTEEITVALLCPPTTQWCSIEIVPPRDAAGTTG
jgi:hypothetical protein